MLSIENISKGFGGRELFDGAGFKINPKERIGLVGPNGHGKTTLLRIIVGEKQPDSGTIVRPKNYRIGYVRQRIQFTKDSVLAEGALGLPAGERDHLWKVEKILAGLGFSEVDMQKPPTVFSGGYQVRLNLAKVLVSEPDLLLLDEPTNYLDITSIRWVERFLQRWPHEVLLITHDRSFMDSIVTHVVGIHRKRMRKMEGDTGKYYGQIALDDEIYEKTRINDERKRKEIEQFITRFRAKARLANLVQSRVKTLAKMEKKEKLEKMRTLDFAFRSQPYQAKHSFAVQDLTFGYDPQKPLIKGFDLSVQNRERIAVIGKNGQGKTTLLKLLAGTLKPDKGEITRHPAVVSGIFEQTHTKTLSDDNTIEDEILYSAEGIDKQLARNICGAMLFSQDDALKPIKVLSGGERNRVVLGKLIATPVNLLFLDEPTNHLDMDACDALLAAIDAFDGTVVMVTHNEMFLQAIAERLVIFQDNKIEVFEGGYQDFLDKRGWIEEGLALKKDQNQDSAPRPSAPKVNKKKLRRQRSAIVAERSRTVKPLETRIAQLEDTIDANEKKMDALNSAMLQASQDQNGAEIERLGKEIHQCQQQIDADFETLEKVSARLEKEAAPFDKKLAEMNAQLE